MKCISQSQKIFTYSFPDQITLTAVSSGVKSKSNKWSQHASPPTLQIIADTLRTELGFFFTEREEKGYII